MCTSPGDLKQSGAERGGRVGVAPEGFQRMAERGEESRPGKLRKAQNASPTTATETPRKASPANPSASSAPPCSHTAATCPGSGGGLGPGRQRAGGCRAFGPLGCPLGLSVGPLGLWVVGLGPWASPLGPLGLWALGLGPWALGLGPRASALGLCFGPSGLRPCPCGQASGLGPTGLKKRLARLGLSLGPLLGLGLPRASGLGPRPRASLRPSGLRLPAFPSPPGALPLWGKTSAHSVKNAPLPLPLLFLASRLFLASSPPSPEFYPSIARFVLGRTSKQVYNLSVTGENVRLFPFKRLWREESMKNCCSALSRRSFALAGPARPLSPSRGRSRSAPVYIGDPSDKGYTWRTTRAPWKCRKPRACATTRSK